MSVSRTGCGFLRYVHDGGYCGHLLQAPCNQLSVASVIPRGDDWESLFVFADGAYLVRWDACRMTKRI